jgi:outer membrane protein assembly factor BamB
MNGDKLAIGRAVRRVMRLVCCLAAWSGLAGANGNPGAYEDGDWRQWRGPGRTGSVQNARLPRDWLERELSVRWRKPVPEGYATPLVDSRRVYIFGREADHEVVQVHDLATGRLRWRVGYPAEYDNRDPKGPHGSGPRATPVLHDERLFTYGINEVLSCLDAETGRRLWRIDFPRQFATEPPGYGASSSPMIAGRHLIVPDGDRLFAIDYRSGSRVWDVEADSFYASIIHGTLDGLDQFIAFSRYRLLGVDAAEGRALWSLPYPSLFGSNIATPVVWEGRVIISSSSQGTRAVRPRRREGRWFVEPVWHTNRLRAYLTSPVVHRDHLYGLDEGGTLFCLSLEDGRTLWSGGTFSDFGTIAVVGDQLLILSGYGDLTAVEATAEAYRELGQKQVANSATWSHLAVAHGCLFVRDKKELTCYSLPIASVP